MVQCRHSGICCFSVEYRIAVACDKNGMLIMCVLIHTCVSTGGRRVRKPTMEKSVNEWEGADRVAGAVVAEDMASVHLSISKHSQLSSLFTGGEVNPFFFSPPAPLPLSFSLPQLLLQTHLSSCHLSFYTSLSHFAVFFQKSLVCFSPLPLYPSPHYPLLPLLLSMEQRIQQQNKAAWSIAHRLIKQGQNSAAFRATLTSGYQAELEWRGGEKSPEERGKDKNTMSNHVY